MSLTLDYLKEEVKKCDIEVAISNYLKKGSSSHYFCSIHDNRNTPSLSVSKSKNIFKCFGCNVGGDVITFYQKYLNLGYKEAVLRAAVEFNIITEQEAMNLNSNNSKDFLKEKKIIEKSKVKKAEKVDEFKREDSYLNKIYSLFSSKMSLLEEDKNYLLNRGLSEDDIKNGQYFSFYTNENEKFAKDFFDYVNSNKIDLKYVPGFFKLKDKDNSWMSTIKSRGIGIPIKNEKDEIVAIQVRFNDDNDNFENRYTWFSSAKVANSMTFEGGASSGSPIGVIKPKRKFCGGVLITEGHFKAIELSKAFDNCLILYVQGVNNTKNIEKILENYKISKIGIAYDSDMQEKEQVLKAALNLGDKLVSNYKVSYLTWDINKGKGIDDYLLNGGKTTDIVKIDHQVLSNAYEICNGDINNFTKLYKDFFN